MSRRSIERQMVMLQRSDWPAWLEGAGNEADLLRPMPVGSLKAEQPGHSHDGIMATKGKYP